MNPYETHKTRSPWNPVRLIRSLVGSNPTRLQPIEADSRCQSLDHERRSRHTTFVRARLHRFCDASQRPILTAVLRPRAHMLALFVALLSLGAAVLAGPAAATHIRIIIIIGPTTPNAHSTPGMKMSFRARRGPAGTTFKSVARGFRRGEYVTAWEFSRGGRSTQLNGGFASRRGRVVVHRTTIAGISTTGSKKVCLQGERSRHVACARYRVTRTGGGTGPGYVPPETGPGYVPPGSA